MQSQSARSFEGPKDPRFFVTLQYLRDASGFYRKNHQRYGSPFLLQTLRGPLVVVSTPEHARAVFTADPDTLAVWGADALDPIVGPMSLLLVSGERHRRDRKLLTPPLHGARMRGYAEVMRQAAVNASGRWSEGSVVRMLQSAQEISLEVILRTVFGAQDSEVMHEWTRLVTTMMESGTPALMFFKALRVAPFGLGPWAHFAKARAAVDSKIYQEIHRRREEKHYGDDVLSLMMQARYDDGSSFSDAELRDELLTLLLAGHETTAISIAWAMWLLHDNPMTLRRLRAELDGLAPHADAEAIAALPYLDAVCSETLRLHPVVIDVVRGLEKPLTIGNMVVPAGFAVSVSIATIHEDPTLYPDPKGFVPERFLQRKFSPFEFLPFGGGHRRCVGAAFAMYEMKQVLAELIRRHTFELASHTAEVSVRRGITFGPRDGAPLRYVGPRSVAPTAAVTH
ncbi:MAG: cytochrome P450 [Deltaproteobacteria bacterium]|nr:cytochrome P450 [Deltaproteobacteria bacterium]